MDQTVLQLEALSKLPNNSTLGHFLTWLVPHRFVKMRIKGIPDRIDNLGPSAVVQCHIENHACIRRCPCNAFFQFALYRGVEFCRSADGSSSVAPLALSAFESQRILATHGRHLIDRYWGRYVAFLHDASRDSTRVVCCRT